MYRGTTRFIIERTVLPNKLYSSGPMMIMNLMGSPGKYMKKLYDAEAAGKERSKYTAADFEETHRVFMTGPASLLIMQIKMPAPEHIDDCRFAYFCYGIPGGNDLYCCSASRGDGTYELFGLTEDGEYISLGSADAPEEEFELISDSYWELIAYDARGRNKNICAG